MDTKINMSLQLVAINYISSNSLCLCFVVFHETFSVHRTNGRDTVDGLIFVLDCVRQTL